MDALIKTDLGNRVMIEEDKYTYALTGLENYYIKEGVFHIIFNEAELVDKKFKVLDIEIAKPKEDKKEENKDEVDSVEETTDIENNN